mmetsp:Transcript_49795/g.95171  ORF Transcript_49795/g.95171 Transcript_49795/m.95171 type:complete len:402 (+) Transcript_49795:16-1221(+)|eukprot:CAMPEP_0114240444 /NCGR_PEP_ID=MMETSP0058-20121206/9075_1 /TAXON_ID=36894 /ORGANISM="Pyramimonas parkeae, CCMP726" /LENGTH=401 /DNA_ID=CAMNT_0001352849 /DNA_START=10 /DNA_END=1215 /DNA_ORIENTATION=+
MPTRKEGGVGFLRRAPLVLAMVLVAMVHWLWPLHSKSTLLSRISNTGGDAARADFMMSSRATVSSRKGDPLSYDGSKELHSINHSGPLANKSSNLIEGSSHKADTDERRDADLFSSTPAFKETPLQKLNFACLEHGCGGEPVLPPPKDVPWTRWTPLVVVCAGSCSWARQKLATRDVVVVECMKKKMSYSFCALQANMGREASSYLMFIVTNYHRLPKRILFMHGHERSWHHKPNVPGFWPGSVKIAVEAQQFKGLNNFLVTTKAVSGNSHPWDWVRGGHDGEAQRFKRQWDDVVKPLLHRECPQEIQCDGSSQFVVPREMVLSLSIDVYASLLAFCVPADKWNPYFDVKSVHIRVSNRGASKKCAFFYEWIWHIIFGEPDVMPVSTGAGLRLQLAQHEGS